MSEPVIPAESEVVPDLAELARVVARQRAEMDRLREQAATSAVVERAKGIVMAQAGCSADTAGETLRRRARAARRTLLEECWITLGGPVPAPPGPGEPPARSGTGIPDGTSAPSGEGPPARPSAPDDVVAAALGRLGRALVHADTFHDLAGCLLEHLAPDLDADSVMIYARRAGGRLELVGHAGVGERHAAQWRQVPPFDGIAVLDALRSGAPLWLEDFDEDSKRYLLIGDPPERWRSRVWLPLSAGDGAELCIGVLRGRSGPFSPRDRAHLRDAVRLCAGRLRTLAAPPEPAATAFPDAVRTLFESLPVAAMLLTPVHGSSDAAVDFRIDAATAQAAAALGETGDGPVGRRLREYRTDLTDEPLWQGCRHVLATGEPYESEPFAHQEVVDGVTALSTYSVQVARLENSLVVTWIRQASSDRQEQRLADLQRLGNLGWANWNLVTHEPSWSSQVFTLLDRDPADGPVRLADLPGLAEPDDRRDLSRAVGALVREAEPLDVLFRVRTARGVRHLRLVAEAVADLNGTPVEVHGFVQDLTARRRAELALVESEREILTQHAVLRAERTLIARLQNALLPLPQRVMDLAGLRVEVAYLPAQADVHVGGDWFSAIELPDGDALFVIGDVAGHGVDAVATMAQLRFTAKGMVITGSSLTGALARLNTLLLHSGDTHGTATMLLARYSPGERRLAWAQAGHTPPLLLRGGQVTCLHRPPGMLLGAATAPRFEEAECRLEPGDRLLLYTDGLVERPPENIDAGLERLAEAVTAHPGGGDGSLRALLDTMLEGERRDDVCVLDIRFPEGQQGRGKP